MTPLSLRAYARYRKSAGLDGTSAEAVSQAIKTGRLKASVVDGKIVDTELADREWTKNTRQRADPTDSPRPPRPPLLEAARPASDQVPDLNTSRALREAALARRDTAHADLAELELAERRGELVDAQTADAGYEEHIARAKTRLLGVPAQLGQRMPDIAQRVVPVAKELIREAIAELALDGQP